MVSKPWDHYSTGKGLGTTALGKSMWYCIYIFTKRFGLLLFQKCVLIGRNRPHKEFLLYTIVYTVCIMSFCFFYWFIFTAPVGGGKENMPLQTEKICETSGPRSWDVFCFSTIKHLFNFSCYFKQFFIWIFLFYLFIWII